jgi:flagellar basal-body rod protein FlgC
MSLFSVMSVSASGLQAQRARAEAIVANLANAETTRTPEGGPYRRQEVILQSAAVAAPFQAVFQTELGAGVQGVEVSEVLIDSREPEKRYLPGHPDADAQGYVSFPRIAPAEEMVDLMGATRGYQANISAVAALKDMVNRSIDLLR